jgi:transposase
VISIPPQANIFVAIAPLDFRNGINGLGRVCRDKLKQDPMSGALFVFRNRRKSALKILVYDGEAFWLMTRRLSRGKITWWPTAASFYCSLKAKELQTLILNGNPQAAEFTDDWKKLTR